MRFKSNQVDGFRVLAVSGVNTVSFAIQATTSAKKDLLGFAVERSDPTENERYFMPGFKVFPSVIPHPDENTQVSTFTHPVQSFVWDDFTGKPGRDYEYFFHPLRGEPKNLDRTAKPIRIKVRTEKLFSDGEHDAFFNRGVASSQAYRRKFENKKPDDLAPAKKAEALKWLRRDLEDAILKFIGNARKGDTLLCCFYEFRYRPVADALKAAIQGGVEVKIIIDAKVNEHKDKKGNLVKSFPRVENLQMLKDAGIAKKHVIERDANPSDIQHNKFMVLLRGKKKQPAEVWTGSTNISMGGFTGQTNVGHWVRNETLAGAFRDYWNLVEQNLGSRKTDSRAVANKRKKDYRDRVGDLGDPPAVIADIPPGVTPIFSPRTGLKVLDLYVSLVDSAKSSSCITLAFGVNERFKDQLRNNTDQNQIVFLLLEKKDAPNKRSKKPFVKINASNNVYKAWGAYIKDPVYQWAKETNAGILKLNQHVSYVHSKFLLMDPLSANPIVVTGSANFSEPSTNANDENMILIRGNQRVADIYFTEFNRLFNHYYFRAVVEQLGDAGKKPDDTSLFLDETGKEWLKKYAPGKLRAKRIKMYADMQGAKTL